ncbi:Hypothetical predicted protein [Octopus vulgaris]|uniref:Uncharacterized protein n=2 Tax=Octopus TaxID=6643 RepID=A0AA36AGI3_OCTVU|nr:uncharacterized protein C5orf49 homolog [Octopus sinensis]CAI9715740.1 Hypothetical predicted protein [Octopus vulgaris]
MTQTISVKTTTDEFLLTGKPCELSGYFFLPPLTKLPPQRTFYNNANVIRDKLSACSYDSHHLSSNEFNTKAHRGDRRFSKLEGLHIAEEEISKQIPSRSSSIYGHRIVNNGLLETVERSHARTNVVRSEFYRHNNINIQQKF